MNNTGSMSNLPKAVPESEINEDSKETALGMDQDLTRKLEDNGHLDLSGPPAKNNRPKEEHMSKSRVLNDNTRYYTDPSSEGEIRSGLRSVNTDTDTRILQQDSIGADESKDKNAKSRENSSQRRKAGE